MGISHSRICTWQSARGKRQSCVSGTGALQCVLSMCMLSIPFYSPHPLIKVPDTLGLCGSEELRGAKQVPASLPPLQNRENSRTVELYRSVLEINFPAEGCVVYVPPVPLWACIEFWRSVIISVLFFSAWDEGIFYVVGTTDWGTVHSVCFRKTWVGSKALQLAKDLFRNLFLAVFQI